jgi:hypothetical protein
MVGDWLLKFDGIFFSALRPIQGHKVQHLLVSSLGQIENIFSISALIPSGKALGSNFNLCTNRNA